MGFDPTAFNYKHRFDESLIKSIDFCFNASKAKITTVELKRLMILVTWLLLGPEVLLKIGPEEPGLCGQDHHSD